MKLHTILTMAVLMSLAACAAKDGSSTGSRAVGRPAGSQADVEAALAKVSNGGQPGLIVMAGAIVKTETSGDTTTTAAVDRVQVAASAGQNADGTEGTVDDENKPLLNVSKSDPALDEIKSDQSYINVGCEDSAIESNVVSGLTKKEGTKGANNSLELKAKVVYLCGVSKITNPFLTVIADELVLKDFSQQNMNSVGLTSISVNSLKIDGTNLISSSGMDSSVGVAQAPSIDINVTKEVTGEGTLKISSTGGNSTAKTKTDTESEDSTSTEKSAAKKKSKKTTVASR